MTQTETYKGKAIVARSPLPKGGWKMEEVSTVPEIKDNELVIEMVASGICHTDVMFGTVEPPFPCSFYPRVMGHEGSGYVRYAGSAVRVAAPGDPVLLSFNYCGSCVSCKTKNLSYCANFNELNFAGHPTFRTSDDKDIPGSFFGQSSFARYSVVAEHSVVNVKDVVTDRKELALFSPLGCGVQTGAGTVINAAKADSESAVAVIGQGGVGLSAIMGAKICGSRIIVGIDKVEKRLELAKELGATHTVNVDKLPEGKTLVDVLREICDGVGPTVTVDTTGAVPAMKSGVEFTRPRGMYLQVGSSPPDFKLELPTFAWMCSGKIYRGCIEGEANPTEFVPKMIQWYRDGRFPLDKMVKYFPADDFAKGLHEMHSGETIKPILLWS